MLSIKLSMMCSFVSLSLSPLHFLHSHACSSAMQYCSKMWPLFLHRPCDERALALLGAAAGSAAPAPAPAPRPRQRQRQHQRPRPRPTLLSAWTRTVRGVTTSSSKSCPATTTDEEDDESYVGEGADDEPPAELLAGY